MAFLIADRVKETFTTTGTGNFTLLGAVTGFRAFNASGLMVNNDTTHYAVKHQAAAEWEVGLGTWLTGGILVRTTIFASSNAAAAVNFSAGTKDVWMNVPANALRTINALTAKTQPVAADEMVLWDSVAGDTKKATWADVFSNPNFEGYADFAELATPANPAASTARDYAYDRFGRSVKRMRTPGGNTFQYHQDNVFVARNESGGTINAFTPVYASGTGGSGEPLIAPARADTAANMPCIGITVEQILNNANGFVMVAGILSDIDTLAFSVNDILYLNPTGGFTINTPPARPNRVQRLGRILSDSATGDAQIVIGPVRASSRWRMVGITIDGAGSPITTGTKGYIEVPIEGVITEWKMVADVSGSCVADVWIHGTPGTVPTNANTITAAAKPTLTDQQIARSSTLTGWTTTVDQGDVIGFEIESASTITRLTLVLVIETDIL